LKFRNLIADYCSQALGLDRPAHQRRKIYCGLPNLDLWKPKTSNIITKAITSTIGEKIMANIKAKPASVVGCRLENMAKISIANATVKPR